MTPTTFVHVKDSLSDDYVVIRPDNWFQLLRQANGLPIEPANPISDGVYRLINAASGKCVALAMEAEGMAGGPQTIVKQTECADDDAQRFRVTATDSGYTKISALNDETQVLEVEAGPNVAEPGARIILGKDVGGESQQWQPVWESEADYHLIARHSDRCLDVPSGSSEDVTLQQWTCNGASAQAFQFADPVWPPPDDEPPPVDEPPPGGPISPPDGGLPPTMDPPDPTSPPGDTPSRETSGRGQGDGGCSLASSREPGVSPFFALGLLLLLGRRRFRYRAS